MLQVSIFVYTHAEHIVCQERAGPCPPPRQKSQLKQNVTETVVNLIAVIVAVTDETPRLLIVNQGEASTPGHTVLALPNGPFEPASHPSLESSLRRWVEAQTGLDLYYVEQLYTFGNRFRDPIEIDGGPRVVSVAYIALTHEDPVESYEAEWHDWYSFMPWEDWRRGRPAVLDTHIEPSLQEWITSAKKPHKRRERQERVNVTFGGADASDMDAVLAHERYELLYEAGLVYEAVRDASAARKQACEEDIEAFAHMGKPLASDHRRILATALGRLRGKLAYRPVVFDLMPGEFTLLLAPIYFFLAMVYPAQNGILQANIRKERRGAVFGWGALVANLTAAVTSVVMGRVLEALRLQLGAVGELGARDAGREAQVVLDP